MKTAHKHAALMALYAQDAAETETPWERWEWVSIGESGWLPCRNHPAWDRSMDYRRKPVPLIINGREVPQPERSRLKPGEQYFWPVVHTGELYASAIWREDQFDMRLLIKGLVHLTKDAAIAHAKALLSFTETPKP